MWNYSFFKTLPNFLTLLRLAIIPILVFCFYIPGDFMRWMMFFLFVLAGITDFLDGFVARIWGQHSSFGRMMDPVADKMLVAVVLFLLVADKTLSGFNIIPALIVLCREILVSGLRAFLSEMQIALPVAYFSKWKTAIQMVALSLLLLGAVLDPFVPVITFLGISLLWAAALLTVQTGYIYVKENIDLFQKT